MVTDHETHEEPTTWPAVDPDGMAEFWYVTHPNCECDDCKDDETGKWNNGIKGYKYNCKWDNFHYNERCVPKGFQTGGENDGNNEEWINKDFKNTTGQARNDLHIEFVAGIKNKIAEIRSPDQLPHVEIASIGDPPMTLISWGPDDPDDPNQTVGTNDTASCCVRIIWGDEKPEKRFKRDPYWTLDGEEKEGVAGCASVNFTVTPDGIGVDAHNTADPNDPAIYVDEFSYAFVSPPMVLSELTWNNVSIPWVSRLWQGTVTPEGSLHLGTIDEAPKGMHLITQFAVNFSDGPPGNKGHIIVQMAGAPSAIPAVSEWGL
ncbi:MAG: hypothetical protein JSU86_05845, partial [Phycisphaerales bacterium]